MFLKVEQAGNVFETAAEGVANRLEFLRGLILALIIDLGEDVDVILVRQVAHLAI